MSNAASIQSFWSAFLKKTGGDASTGYADCYHFGNTKEMADELLVLVLTGVKRATASSALYYECSGEPLPQAGDFNIITDWEGNPRCVTKVTAVTILPFKDITVDICKREGEDETLESWQEGHAHFFTEDGKVDGYEFSWDMPVVFVDFEVVYTA